MRALIPLALLAACAKAPPAPAASPAPAAPKNVVLVIGDGMGPQQIGLLELYARRAPGVAPRETTFARMAREGVLGLSMHFPMDRLVVDSACSATQIALGLAAPSESIGVDAEGNPQPTVLEVARDRGEATGLVSDTRITHATPAAFGAHVAHRSMEDAIAAGLLETGVDVMLSGGRRHFLPRGTDGGRRDDGRDLLAEAREAGWDVVTDRDALASAGDRVLGLFARSGMMDALAERATRDAPDRTEPDLATMTTAALDRLARDEDGFFLMVESGQVDWAGHGNDAGWLLAEMQRADATIEAILDWAEADGETLVVVTADHETGGFGVSYNRHDVPAPVDLPGTAFADVDYAPNWNFVRPERLTDLAAQTATWGSVLDAHADLPEAERTAERLATMLTAAGPWTLDADAASRILASKDDPHGDGTMPAFHDFDAFYSPASYSRTGLVARELAAEQGVVWATGTHTHTPVPVFAVGPGADAFAGLQHHTDLGQKLRAAVQAR